MRRNVSVGFALSMIYGKAAGFFVGRLTNCVRAIIRPKKEESLPAHSDEKTGSTDRQLKPLAHQLLERRLLLDAAGLSTLADVADSINDASVTKLVKDLGLHEEYLPDGSAQPADNKNEIYIIDGSIAGLSSLLTNLGNSDNVFIIDPSTDGFAQLTTILSELDGVDAIHVLSHGDKNEIHLGDAIVTNDNVAQFKETFLQWSAALSEDADILFYGCEINRIH